MKHPLNCCVLLDSCTTKIFPQVGKIHTLTKEICPPFKAQITQHMFCKSFFTSVVNESLTAHLLIHLICTSEIACVPELQRSVCRCYRPSQFTPFCSTNCVISNFSYKTAYLLHNKLYIRYLRSNELMNQSMSEQSSTLHEYVYYQKHHDLLTFAAI